MTDVKRRYHAPHRQRQAQDTRERIASAARTLFGRDGYAATRIDAIAREAGVAVQTVYATFGSKRAILLALLDAMEAEGGVHQLQLDLAEAAGDPARQICRWVAFSRRFFEQGADLVEIARNAGTSDPDVRALWEEGEERRRSGARARAREWAALGALRSGVDEESAADILWTLLSPEVFRLLAGGCSWPGERYESWLIAELKALLDERFRDDQRG